MSKAVEVQVTGRVQGVSFRAATQHEAERLGVSGWVQNASDGSVHGHFEGDGDSVDRLVDWCRSGPGGARVENVAVREASAADVRGFHIRR